MQSAIVLTLVVAAGLVLWRHRPARGLPESLLTALIPVCVVVVFMSAVHEMAVAPTNKWNGIRLAPSAALLNGHPLYALPGEGPMLGHLYGPVSPLVYLPAALLPTPALAIRAGVGLTLMLFLLPAVLLARVGSSARGVVNVSAVVLFALYSVGSDVLAYSAFWIHADTPAVVFAVLASLPLLDAARRHDPRWMAASALLTVLAVGSKQPALPVVIALPAYLWMVDGWRMAARYAGLVAGWGLAAGVVMLGALDVRAMVYQAMVVPAEHAWRFGDGWSTFVRVLRDLVPRALAPAVVVAIFGGWRLWQARAGFRLRPWIDANPWVAPLLVAACCLPTAILGRMKVGGSVPTLTFVIYPLVVAALLAFLRFASGPGVAGRPPRATLAAVLLLVALAATARATVSDLPSVEATVTALGRDPDRAAFAFVQAHPGEVYLPLDPLISLMAEGQAYNVLLPTISAQYFEYAAAGADLSTSTADDRVLMPYVPRNLRYVMFPVHEGSATTLHLVRPGVLLYLRRYLPEFTTLVPLVPGWAAFVSTPP